MCFFRTLSTCYRGRFVFSSNKFLSRLKSNSSSSIPRRNFSHLLLKRVTTSSLQNYRNSGLSNFFIFKCCEGTDKKFNEFKDISNGKGSSAESGKSSNSGEKKKSDQFSKKAMKYTFLAFGTIFTAVSGILVYEWGSPQIDDNGCIITDEFSDMPKLKAYILRTYKEMRYYDKMIKEPSREKLLPDPLTEPYFQPPYTLVLEMTGVLVHPDWTYQTGWRFKKRPGVDYFLSQVGPPLFEVVIFTSEQGFTAFPILDSLDPNGYIMYRLFRDATRYVNGHHVKDLSCLNRDLSKVIFLDWDDKSFQCSKDNALKLKRWTGSDDDKTLYDLASLLRTVATSGVDDVRPVLEYYGQFDDPIAVFKENQRKLHEEEEKRFKEERGKKLTLAGAWSSNLFSRR